MTDDRMSGRWEPPNYRGELAVGNVGQHLCLFQDDVIGPIWTRARSPSRVRHTYVLDGAGSRPDDTCGRCIVPPSDILGVERVRQRGMLEARVLCQGLVPRGINQSNVLRWRRSTT